MHLPVAASSDLGMQVLRNRRLDKPWSGRRAHIGKFGFFKALRILGLKTLQPLNHLSNWTWKRRLAVCVQPLPTPTFRLKRFRTVSTILPSALYRNLLHKGFGFLPNQTATIPRQISEVSRFQQIGQLAKFFFRHSSEVLLDGTDPFVAMEALGRKLWSSLYPASGDSSRAFSPAWQDGQRRTLRPHPDLPVAA